MACVVSLESQASGLTRPTAELTVRIAAGHHGFVPPVDHPLSHQPLCRIRLPPHLHTGDWLSPDEPPSQSSVWIGLCQFEHPLPRHVFCRTRLTPHLHTRGWVIVRGLDMFVYKHVCMFAMFVR